MKCIYLEKMAALEEWQDHCLWIFQKGCGLSTVLEGRTGQMVSHDRKGLVGVK